MSSPSPELIKHREAMRLSRKAEEALAAGRSKEAVELYGLAFQLEKAVALTLLDPESHEPTRSVMFRSAASLGMLAGEYREAERLIAQGLAGNPPDVLAEELRTLFEHVNLRRHLSFEGILVGSVPTQLSLQGQLSENWPKDVGTGPKQKSTIIIAEDKLIAERLKSLIGPQLGKDAVVIAADSTANALQMAHTLLHDEEYVGTAVAVALIQVKSGQDYARMLLGDDSAHFVLTVFPNDNLADYPAQLKLIEDFIRAKEKLVQ